MDASVIDHQQAVDNMMAERYLLGELAPQELDAFEAHVFECSTCFEQVRAGTELVDYIKQGGGVEEPAVTATTPRWRQLLGQALRPAPAFAFAACLLAAASVYQNVVTIQMLKAPQPESRYTLEEESRGLKEIVVPPNSRFRLALDFQSQPQFVSYEVQLVKADGKFTRTMRYPVQPSQDQAGISVYAGDLTPGRYSMVVQATDQNGNKQELARGSFKLQFQN
jgi:hypothetical protein